MTSMPRATRVHQRAAYGALGLLAIVAAMVYACGSNGPQSPPAPSSSQIASLSVSGTTPAVGASSQFTATAKSSNGTNQDVTSAATWQSTTPSVASVSASGMVTAVGPGDAEVHATYQNTTGSLHISVAGPPTFTLFGVVARAGSSSPVQGATISILDGPNASRTTATDGNGYYSLGSLKDGSFTLRAVNAGYVTIDQPVDLTADRRLDFTMTANPPPPPAPAPTPVPAPPPAPGPSTPVCNASLWNYIYDPTRLRVVDACRTVTGTITDQHPNADGDIDVRLEVDPEYKNLLNAGNISNLSGHLQTEAICQAPITDAAAIRACQGFRGTVVVPPNGTRVRVTGTYLLDLNHGWMELHPISALTVIH
jgi:hypothetical protein